MHIRTSAILLSARAQGETAVIARLFTEDHGVVAAYIAGGRGRRLRPVVIPGNLVEAELDARSDNRLPFARLELARSRGPWLAEPLPSAAISWVCALTASVLPERNPYPSLYEALAALLEAICNAPSARGWVPGLARYEALLLRDLGYGGERPEIAGLDEALEILDRIEPQIARYLLADTRTDVLAARTLLRQRLARMTE